MFWMILEAFTGAGGLQFVTYLPSFFSYKNMISLYVCKVKAMFIMFIMKEKYLKYLWKVWLMKKDFSSWKKNPEKVIQCYKQVLGTLS